MAIRAVVAGPVSDPTGLDSESLFDRFAWLYAFCREHLFRDDSERIARALWPGGDPAPGSYLLELGCGPGFYSCRFAGRFRRLQVVGVDCSEKQLCHARSRAAALGLDNCSFERDNVLSLGQPGGVVDAVLVSRLFTILPEREPALAEMHRVLRSGGRCFVAEPRSALRASVPLRTMWLLARLWALSGNGHVYREPSILAVLSSREFDALIASQPWKQVRLWQDTWYQYALCEKGVDGPQLSALNRSG